MSNDRQKLIGESRIIRFFAGFNDKMIRLFYSSFAHRLFIGSLGFFRKAILLNIAGSAILNTARKVSRSVGVIDIGVFVISVVVLNTAIMALIGRRIDIFSWIARVAFFLTGFAVICAGLLKSGPRSSKNGKRE